MNSLDNRDRVGVALLVLRLTVFLVMLIWTIDKFVRPDHPASVYEHFYFLRGFGPAIIYAIGMAELVLLIGFVIGFAPRLTSGLVLLLHTVSTFSSFRQYLHPYDGPNILFFAAWPILGACFALYLPARSRHAVAGRREPSLRSPSPPQCGAIILVWEYLIWPRF